MCSDYRLLTNAAAIFEDFSELKIGTRFPEGKPNLEAREGRCHVRMSPADQGLFSALR